MKKPRYVRRESHQNLGVLLNYRRKGFFLVGWIILMLFCSSLPGQDKEKTQPVSPSPTKVEATVSGTTEPTGIDNDSATVASPIMEKSNPFTLETNRIAPGGTIKVGVDKEIFDSKRWTVKEVNFCFATTPTGTKRDVVPITRWYFSQTDDDLFLVLCFPDLPRMKKIKGQSSWGGIFIPYKGELVITYGDGEKFFKMDFVMEIPDWPWAFGWALLISLFLLPLLSKFLYGCFSIKKLVGSVTREGVSISKVQMYIWTVIILFGVIYVYLISGKFLTITPQILFLLGIGGGTAVAAKQIATKPVPGNEKKEEQPSQSTKNPPAKETRSDSTDITTKPVPENEKKEEQTSQATNNPPARETKSDSTDFTKMQMLAFTLVIGCIVVKEIVSTNTFPDLPESLILIMGISNSLYLGNKYKRQ